MAIGYHPQTQDTRPQNLVRHEVGGQFGRFDRVVQEHGNGHRADAAGNGGNKRGLFLDRLEIDVADKAKSLLLRRILDAVDAHIDDDDAFFDHVGGDRVGPAGRPLR